MKPVIVRSAEHMEQLSEASELSQRAVYADVSLQVLWINGWTMLTRARFSDFSTQWTTPRFTGIQKSNQSLDLACLAAPSESLEYPSYQSSSHIFKRDLSEPFPVNSVVAPLLMVWNTLQAGNK